MPSPIAHSVTGYVIARSKRTRTSHKSRWVSLIPAAIYSIVVSNLPDLDFLPQLLSNIRFHRGPSHSLLAALIISSLLAWIFRQRAPYKSLFCLTLALYGSHIVLDLFTQGGSGLPLFWPLSSQTFQAPFSLFPAVHHSRGLLDISHFTFIAVELIYAVCLLIGLKHFTRFSDL